MAHPSIEKFLEATKRENPLHVKFLESSLGLLDDREKNRLNQYIDFYLSQGHTFPTLATAYLQIVKDTAKEELFFMRTGHYRFSKFSEVEKSVYHDATYMRHYMTGLALSSFLWPNHFQLRNFFKEQLPKDNTGIYLEIGPGHGFNMLEAMALTSFSRFDAIDLSPASIEMTEMVLSAPFHSAAKKHHLILDDFLTRKFSDQYDAIVMGEVLEHVENPQDFLRRAGGLAIEKNPFIFITTCINAPAVDHIYQFKQPQDVREVVAAAGLVIRKELLLPFFDPTTGQARAGTTSYNIGMVLTKGADSSK